MEDGIWQFGRLILFIGGFIAVMICIYWLDYSGWTFRIQKWIVKWIGGTLSLVGGLISFGYMIDTIDFDKPIFLSVYWSTLGYLVLSIVLLLAGTGIFLIKDDN